MRRLAATLLALLLLAGAPAEARGEEPPPDGADVRGPLPTQKAGALRSLIASRANSRPTVVHFWATWCDACREEFPRLRPVLLDRDLGASVILLAVDERKSSRKARRMIRQWGLATLPAWRLEDPDPEAVARAMDEPAWNGTLPATFVFDAAGRKVRSFVGASSAQGLRAAVETAKMKK